MILYSALMAPVSSDDAPLSLMMQLGSDGATRLRWGHSALMVPVSSDDATQL